MLAWDAAAADDDDAAADADAVAAAAPAALVLVLVFVRTDALMKRERPENEGRRERETWMLSLSHRRPSAPLHVLFSVLSVGLRDSVRVPFRNMHPLCHASSLVSSLFLASPLLLLSRCMMQERVRHEAREEEKKIGKKEGQKAEAKLPKSHNRQQAHAAQRLMLLTEQAPCT